MSTPKEHGYVKCARCNCWRRGEYVMVPELATWPDGAYCIDSAWCSRQSGAGLGRLDADTGSEEVQSSHVK